MRTSYTVDQSTTSGEKASVSIATEASTTFATTTGWSIGSELEVGPFGLEASYGSSTTDETTITVTRAETFSCNMTDAGNPDYIYGGEIVVRHSTVATDRTQSGYVVLDFSVDPSSVGPEFASRYAKVEGIHLPLNASIKFDIPAAEAEVSMSLMPGYAEPVSGVTLSAFRSPLDDTAFGQRPSAGEMRFFVANQNLRLYNVNFGVWLPYDPATLTPGQESRLQVYWFNPEGTTGTWEPLNGYVLPLQHTVYGQPCLRGGRAVPEPPVLRPVRGVRRTSHRSPTPDRTSSCSARGRPQRDDDA